MKIVYAAVLVGILTATYFVENWQTGLFTTGAVLLFLGAKLLEARTSGMERALIVECDPDIQRFVRLRPNRRKNNCPARSIVGV